MLSPIGLAVFLSLPARLGTAHLISHLISGSTAQIAIKVFGDDLDTLEHLAGDSDDVRVGALGDQDSEPSHEEYFSFDDLHERVEERTADVSDASVPAAAVDPGAPWAADDWHASASDEGEEPATDDGFAEDDEFDDVDDQNVITGGSGGRRGGYAPATVGGPAMVGGSNGDRDLPTAVAVGVGLFVVAAIALKLGPGFAVALVALALGAAAAEFFNVLDTVGWASAKFVGIVTCFLFPIAVFWRGELAYPLVTFLLIAAVLSWYLVGAGGPDPRVLEGSGATVLGVMWIGGLGSTAAAMLDLHDGRALFLIAVIATVGYDVGAYFIGKAAGHRPLSSASPNKTVEGLVGGMAVALFLTIILVGALKLGPWDGPAAALVLGIGAACAAPLGDLCQSLLKRDLGVKDMSSFIPGHGGILDRFDSMLFVLPTVFLLYVTLGH